MLRQKPDSLVRLCVKKLATSLIKYGPKRFPITRFPELPAHALEELLGILMSSNALHDLVLKHVLCNNLRSLSLQSASQLRRSILNLIGPACPNLQELDVRDCKQVNNHLVRECLRNCGRLSTLLLDGCRGISDRAFTEKKGSAQPLIGLISLQRLSVGKCSQLTAEGLDGLLQSARHLRALSVSFCRIAITDAIASKLLCHPGLEVLDLSFCSAITDSAFKVQAPFALKELLLSNTAISDVGVEHITTNYAASHERFSLEVFDANYASILTDRSVAALAKSCPRLRKLCLSNTQITNESFSLFAEFKKLQILDVSWCLNPTARAFEILGNAVDHPPLQELNMDHCGAMNLFAQQRSPDMSPVLARPNSTWSSFGPFSPNMTTPPMPGSGYSPIPPTFSLPAAACTSADEELNFSPRNGDIVMPAPQATSLSMRCLVQLYSASIQCLFLDGASNGVDAALLFVIAQNCGQLRKLAVSIEKSADSGSTDDDLQCAVRALGESCAFLTFLLIDCSSRPHWPVISAMEVPAFRQLDSFTLRCAEKGRGLCDGELKAILEGRKDLKTLMIHSCKGLTAELFPQWCSWNERIDEEEVDMELDEALFFGGGLGSGLNLSANEGPTESAPSQMAGRARRSSSGQSRRSRRSAVVSPRNSRNPAALTLGQITTLALYGASSLTDRSCEGLGELLVLAQSIDLQGSPEITEEGVRSFRKQCKFLRSVEVVSQRGMLKWSAASAFTKTQRRRRRRGESGSSGTETE